MNGEHRSEAVHGTDATGTAAGEVAPRRVSRRVVIGGIVGTAALAVGGVAVAALVDRDDDTASRAGSSGTTPKVRGGEGDELRRVGRRYLEVVPAENDDAALVRELRTAGLDPERLDVPTGLRAAAARDYAAGAVLLLDGWLISRTEGRYAALIARRS
jgi:hypothetical protein